MNNRLLLVLAVALAACAPSQPQQRPPLEGARIGGPFALTNQDGQAVTDQTFAGKYRLMYFGYTFCPDVCPTDMQNVGAGLKLLEKSDPALARRVVPVMVTVDPARDTPAAMKQFVSAFHPRMVGLTGSPQAIAALQKAYAVYSKRGQTTPGGGYLMDHQNTVFMMNPDGKPLALIPADDGPQAVAAEIAKWAT